MLYGAIAGTIPDLDVLLNFITDEISATAMHRGFSHSLLFCTLLAPLLGWLLFKFNRKEIVSIKQWTLMFFLVLVTHPILDANTTWGTQFFWPFEIRLAFNNIFVIDPLYTLPFLILVLAAMFYKRTSIKRRRLNNLALILSSSYLLLTFIFKGIGVYQFKKALNLQDIDHLTLFTKPTPLNTILWNAQIETENGYRSAYYSFFDKKSISFDSEIPKGHDLLSPYKNQEDIRTIIELSRGFYFVEEVEDGFIYTDMKFGQYGFTEDAPYTWQYGLTKEPDGSLSIQKLDFPAGSNSIPEALSSLIERIKGNKLSPLAEGSPN
jgi:inner membrane protein